MRASKKEKKTYYKGNQVSYPTENYRKINMIIKKGIQNSE